MEKVWPCGTASIGSEFCATGSINGSKSDTISLLVIIKQVNEIRPENIWRHPIPVVTEFCKLHSVTYRILDLNGKQLVRNQTEWR